MMFDMTMTDNRLKVIEYFLKYPECMEHRSVLQDLFTLVEKYEVSFDVSDDTVPINDRLPYVEDMIDLEINQLVCSRKKIYKITQTYINDNNTQLYLKLEDTGFLDSLKTPLMSPQVEFILKPGQIGNYPNDGNNKDLKTSFGLFMSNYLLLSSVFKDTIPYQNKEFTPSLLEGLLTDHILKKNVTVDSVHTFYNNVLYLSNLAEFFVPNISMKSLMTNPLIEKRKKELLQQHKKALQDGDPIVMSMIEKELIAMDKESLKDDVSSRYFQSKKQWNVVRKKSSVLLGMSEKFSSPGNFNFIENSLEEGWKQKDLPALCNDSRAGSYGRAKETADGGNIAKITLRVFQNLAITSEDCGTTKYNNVMLHQHNYRDYIGRNYMDGNTLTVLTEDIAKQKIGHLMRFRSPLYCAPDKDKGSTKGICYTCMGQIFKQLGQTKVATSIQSFSSKHLSAALKKFHGTVVSTVHVDDLDDFTI